MKKLFFTFIFALIITAPGFAQDVLQGSITYSMKFMGEQAAQVEAFLPKSYSFKIRKSDMLTEMEGGMAAMMMGKILVLGKKGKVYMLKDSEQTAYEMTGMSGDKEEKTEAPKPKIEKEDETIDILGYECQKYKVTLDTEEGPVTQYLWVTDKLKFPEVKGGGMSGGMGGGMSVKGINGLALKTMANQNGMTIIMTATSIEEGSLDKNLFKIPKGYAKEDFDPSSMMGGMGM